METISLTWKGSAARAEPMPVLRNPPRRRLRIPLPGLLTICILCLVAAASFTSEANLLLLLFGIGTGLLMFNLLACMRMVRRIEVDRSLAGTAVAGRPFEISYTVRNRHRWLNAWALQVGEVPSSRHAPVFPGGFVMMLPPGHEQRVRVAAVWPFRGRIHLCGLRITCGFPFGLFTCTVDLPAPARLVVYPAVGRVRREFRHQQFLSEMATARRVDQAVGGDEFHGVREYRQGDNLRWIHWRRSAHTGQLVVREYRPLRESRLVVLLDPWPLASHRTAERRGLLAAIGRPSRPERRDTAVEGVINAAATAVCDALDRGHRVGLICRAAVPVVIAPAGGRSHRRRLLHELALLTPGGNRSLDQLIGGIRWSSNWSGRCLLFATRAEETHGRVLRVLGARTESTMLVTPQSGWLDKLFDLSSAETDERRAS